MNIIKAQNLLKNASDEMLERYLASPTGDFPEYLVASEKLRRDDVRQRYATESQGKPAKTSIIEELLQRDNAALRAPTEPAVPQMPMEAMPQTAQGLGSVPPPPDMQMTPPPMLAAAQEAPQQFYDGGVVALAEGGDISGDFNEYIGAKSFSKGGIASTQNFQVGGAPKIAPAYTPDLSRFDVNPQLMQIQEVPQAYDLPYYQKQMVGMIGPSGTEGYQEALTKQREAVEGRKKNYLSDFLIRSGLGMASSRSPFALQAAAQGLAEGFEDYQKAREADTASERALMESEFKFKQAKRAEDMGLLGLSRQVMGDAVNARNAAIESNRAAEALKINAATGREAALRGAMDLGLRGEEVVLRGKEIAAANQRHREQMAMEEKRIKAQIERENAITPAVKVNAANVVSDAVVRYRKQLEEFPPEWYANATSKIESLPTGSVAQQVEMQRLENLIRMRSGVSEDILKIAGFK
jgi:hypothetical protein